MSSTKRKVSPVKVAKPVSKKTAKTSAKTRVNEANASVVSVAKATRQDKDEMVIEISSESDNDEYDNASIRHSKVNGADGVAQQDGHDSNTGFNGQAAVNEDDDTGDVSDHEPTFGDLAREQETVDVPAILGLLRQTTDDSTTTTFVKTPGSAAAAPSLASLGNLLNAALRNNDDANLEVCFNTTTDATWVRNTIQRMDPALAGPLLQKLAARMYRRPGRAQTLIGWVQWTLITHSGALVSQPGVTKALQELHRVLEERARGLTSLLMLKGKLDMLEAQMQLRRDQRGDLEPGRSGRKRPGQCRRGSQSATLVDNESLVTTYVEGEEDVAGQILVNGTGISANTEGLGDSDMEAEEIIDDVDSEDDVGDDGEDELEEMDDDDEVNDDEVDFDDVDEDDDEDDEDDDVDRTGATPPAKMQKKSTSTFSKRI